MNGLTQKGIYILRHIADFRSYMAFGKMDTFPVTAFDSSLACILKVTFLENDALHVVALFECYGNCIFVVFRMLPSALQSLMKAENTITWGNSLIFQVFIAAPCILQTTQFTYQQMHYLLTWLNV